MKLVKKVILTGEIKTLTGLHVGASKEGITIGGIDNPVLRDPVTNIPYIPGSTLKGKIRSLLEKAKGRIGRNNRGDYTPCQCGACDICLLFGVPVEVAQDRDTILGRLIFRDAFMTEESKRRLEKADNLTMPYTETKYEVAIDRVTSKANPRPIERVPADTVFDFEIVLNVYEGDDLNKFLQVLEEGIKLLNDDYLGGSGTRGSGKVEMKITQKICKDEEVYLGKKQPINL